MDSFPAGELRGVHELGVTHLDVSRFPMGMMYQKKVGQKPGGKRSMQVTTDD